MNKIILLKRVLMKYPGSRLDVVSLTHSAYVHKWLYVCEQCFRVVQALLHNTPRSHAAIDWAIEIYNIIVYDKLPPIVNIKDV